MFLKFIFITVVYHLLIKKAVATLNNQITSNPVKKLDTENTEFSSWLSNSAHSLDINELITNLNINTNTGHSSITSSSLLLQYGENKLSESPPTTILSLIIDQFSDKLVQILIGVAVLSSILASFENNNSAFIEPVIIISILVSVISVVISVYVLLLLLYILCSL